jgi:hypothetical protein
MAVLAAVCIFGCSGGGAADVSAPQAKAEAALAAINTMDWQTYGSLMHPEALTMFGEMVQPALMQMAPKDSLGNPVDSFPIVTKWFPSDSLFKLESDAFFSTVFGAIFESSPQLSDAFKGMQATVLGGIYEGDDVCHLTVRTSMSVGMQAIDEMSVATMKLDNGEWKIMMTPQVRGITELLLQSMMSGMRRP